MKLITFDDNDKQYLRQNGQSWGSLLSQYNLP